MLPSNNDDHPAAPKDSDAQARRRDFIAKLLRLHQSVTVVQASAELLQSSNNPAVRVEPDRLDSEASGGALSVGRAALLLAAKKNGASKLQCELLASALANVEMPNPRRKPALTDAELCRLYRELSRLFDIDVSQMRISASHPAHKMKQAALEQASENWRNPESTKNAAKLELYRIAAQLFELARSQRSCLFNLEERLRIAWQILDMTCRPQDISQGVFHTCNVTVIQKRIFTRKPAMAAKLIVDIAMTGHYKTADGSDIVMTPAMLRLDNHASVPSQDGLRNLAGMIFQRTAVNVYWQRQPTRPDGQPVTKGSIVFHQFEPRIRDGKVDTGERLLDLSKSPPQELVNPNWSANNPNLGLPKIVEIYAQINGGVAPPNLILSAGWYENDSGCVPMITSSESLRRILRASDFDQQFPLFVSVPKHIFVVRDYDAASDTVSVDNSWSSKEDFLGEDLGSRPRLHVDELYRQMVGLPEKKQL